MSRYPDASLLQAVADTAGFSAPPGQAIPVGGGSIAGAWYLEADDRAWFLKTMPAGETLAAEQDGLEAIAATDTVRVPRPLAAGSLGGQDWLLLEWLALESPSAEAWADLGERLAAMHGVPQESFGWHRDNFIGSTPQWNPCLDDWSLFFRDARLGYQLSLARERGLDSAAGARVERLMAHLDALLPESTAPSLLHGDLWSGNIAAVGDQPVIFDPAVYRGHSEADLAMMELFGAPPGSFWSAYKAVRPLESGYRLRRDLYNLYHLLNHFNLFGGGYAGSVSNITDRLLAEVSG